jgi:hypothetical protein
MEVVIDYKYLTGARGEEVPKEVSVASENVYTRKTTVNARISPGLLGRTVQNLDSSGCPPRKEFRMPCHKFQDKCSLRNANNLCG